MNNYSENDYVLADNGYAGTNYVDEVIEILGDRSYAYSGKSSSQTKGRIALLVTAILGVQLLMLGIVLCSLVISAHAFPVRLSAPSNLIVQESSLTLTWDEVEGAEGYIVYVNGREHEVNSNSFSLENITTRGSKYYFKVRALSTNRRSDSNFSVMIDWTRV